MSKKKPPLDITPKHLWRQKRADEIREAIIRAQFEGVKDTVPDEWYSEIAELEYPHVKDELILAASNAMNALSVLTHGLSASKAKGAVAIDMENVEDTFLSLQRKMVEWKDAFRFVDGTKENTEDFCTYAETATKLSADVSEAFRKITEKIGDEIWRRAMKCKIEEAKHLAPGGVVIDKENPEPILSYKEHPIGTHIHEGSPTRETHPPFEFVKHDFKEGQFITAPFLDKMKQLQSDISEFREAKLFEKFVETLAPYGYTFADRNELIEFMKKRQFIRATPSSIPMPRFGEVVSYYFVEDGREPIHLFTYKEVLNYGSGFDFEEKKYNEGGLIQITFLDDAK